MDDVVIFARDPGTEVRKKNRKRHAKDGCPKSERGKPKFDKPFQSVTLGEFHETDYTAFAKDSRSESETKMA